ncbi:MAG: alpha/beta fold hydrolase [Pseudomonadota bacterium]
MQNVLGRTASLAVAASAVLASADAFANELPGYDRLAISAPHRAALVQGSVWYPLGTMTYRSRVGDSAIFKGAPVAMGAGIKPGRHSLIVLSHGSGGNMDGLAWLASKLVAEGFMVLAVNHPGSTSGDSSPRRSIKVWERARDLSTALEALLADPAFAMHVDRERIAAMGFSLGGLSVLQLAGLVPDKQAFVDYCARMKGARDCVFLAKGGVRPEAIDASGFERPAQDGSISAVVAVDPAMGYAFKPQSFTAVDLPVRIINLGKGADLWPEVDAGPTGSDLARKLPSGSLSYVAPADHYAFLGECREGARQLLDREGGDPICENAPGSVRSVVHRDVAKQVVAFLRQALK